jgi:hypothetical protein
MLGPRYKLGVDQRIHLSLDTSEVDVMDLHEVRLKRSIDGELASINFIIYALAAFDAPVYKYIGTGLGQIIPPLPGVC